MDRSHNHGRVEASRHHSLKFWTVPQVAKMMEMSRKTIYAYAKDNSIPHFRFGRNVRIPEVEMWEWIERHMHRPRHSSGNNSSKNIMPGAGGLKE
jgi:excisionase family DNA binding protein